MDIYNMSGFKWWCKQRRKTGFTIIAIIVFFVFCFCSSFVSSMQANYVNDTDVDKVAWVISCVIYGIMILFFLLAAIRKMRIIVDEYWCGTITDFDNKIYGTGHKKKSRNYILADVDGKEMEARPMPETYSKAEKGQQIIIFRVNGKKRFYCVHPEM